MRNILLRNPEPIAPEPVPEGTLSELQEFIANHPRLFVITGAGISCESGIPAYRDTKGNWQSRTPVQHSDFMSDPASRQSYWMRSFYGWPTVANAQPNQAHRALVRLEELGYIQTLVTQNIDRLHQKAGQKHVFDLHGRLDQVICMECDALHSRNDIQHWLREHNPRLDDLGAEPAPDGDAHIQDTLVHKLRIPNCSRCGGLLKPNVVFYGGSVEAKMIKHLSKILEQVDALLAVGTSLMVYSSYRFCKQARQMNIPLLCINEGLTRADNLFALKLADDCTDILNGLSQSLPQLN
ncbi:MAG: NAD-dependent protein deacetylase [Gammaproteobacteria bacterium]|nr:NAD-dependent protein deacetylase [Gammaproteobacteria bacterium]